MKLRALRLWNVRSFGGRGVALEDIGDGVNVLSAANEQGKSTCFDALHALFFQPHSGTAAAVRALHPYSGGSPRTEADIETDEGQLRVAKQYFADKQASVTDITTGRLVAQADEAEAWIAALARGEGASPTGQPAGRHDPRPDRGAIPCTACQKRSPTRTGSRGQDLDRAEPGPLAAWTGLTRCRG